MIRTLCLKNLQYFSLNFSKLSPEITSSGLKNYKVGSVNAIDGYMTRNSKGETKNLHTVIMVHEWWGFNKSMTVTAQQLSNDSIRVYVPDFYRGEPAKDAQEAGHKMSHLNWPKALQDIGAMKEHFESNSKSVSIAGFCMGGALTFAALSTYRKWHGGFSFYGIPDLNIFKLNKIDSPVLAQFGRLDPLKGFSDAESATQLAKNAKHYNYPIEVKIWQMVSHAFCNQDSPYFSRETRDAAFNLVRQRIMK